MEIPGFLAVVNNLVTSPPDPVPVPPAPARPLIPGQARRPGNSSPRTVGVVRAGWLSGTAIRRQSCREAERPQEAFERRARGSTGTKTYIGETGGKQEEEEATMQLRSMQLVRMRGLEPPRPCGH